MGTTKDIRDAVEAELEFDPLVDDADIHVVNINGDVTLNGTVPSYPQYLEAAAAAQRVSGVKNVHNHLEVVLPDADFRDDAMLTTGEDIGLPLASLLKTSTAKCSHVMIAHTLSPAKKRALIARGVDVIDLGAGDADYPPPAEVIEVMQRAVAET